MRSLAIEGLISLFGLCSSSHFGINRTNLDQWAGRELSVLGTLIAAQECGNRLMIEPSIIERAFELACGSRTVDEVRKALKDEGYANVDAHLAGASIKAELKRCFPR